MGLPNSSVLAEKHHPLFRTRTDRPRLDNRTNFDPETDMHIHALKTDFKDAKHVTEVWDAFADGKKATTQVIEMSKP